MHNPHHIGHAAKEGAKIVENLSPLQERREPVVAFGAGLLLGAIGVALYLKSAKDFFICLGLFILASIMLPGFGSILGWLFAPVYGAWRAHTSNENLGV